MLPVFVTVTVLLCASVSLLLVLIPTLVPVVVKAIPRLTVSEPLMSVAISLAVPPFLVPVPFVLPSLLVITKSSAITGADKARQTKADVPSRTLLECFKFMVFTLSIGRMASVLGKELLNLINTTKHS
ncbi:hypothetical protein N9401_06820 [Amylibacter sp.]|nr:hypothetical protein [Amylibacter sp.]